MSSHTSRPLTLQHNTLLSLVCHLGTVIHDKVYDSCSKNDVDDNIQDNVYVAKKVILH